MRTAWDIVLELQEKCIEAGNAKYNRGSDKLEDYMWKLKDNANGTNPFSIIERLQTMLEETD
tara:strand:- start:362 stop:547 length:186 start_codon:yes stop_codon:yes gene_type:complete